jgi:hypothetical protein
VAITQTVNSATMGATEFFLAANSTTKSLDTTSCIVQAFVYLASIAAGDLFEVKFYREINNVEVSQVLGYIDGASGDATMMTPAVGVGGASGAWDFSVKKLTGTDRTGHWELFKVA